MDRNKVILLVMLYDYYWQRTPFVGEMNLSRGNAMHIRVISLEK